jgi:predicted unusual protein kinase regulating ubiquinone biosynthesis (AarF/ABC1/UbiB family)
MKELGKSPTSLFSRWDPDPISSASIGQVHRATLPAGTEVVVKVQYPNIEKALKSDLSNAALVEFLVTLLYRKQTTGTLVKELKERLLEECDYQIEMENQARFRECFEGQGWCLIPKVYPELTTKNVITMDYCEGKTLDEFVRTASQERLDEAGARVFRFAHESIFKHRMFNCDPQPGNYLFSDSHVVFLDFGCVKRFAAPFMELWRQQVWAVLEKKEKRIDELTMEIGLVKDPDRFDFDYHRQLLYLYYQPMMETRPFFFTPEYIEKTWRVFVVENPNRDCMHLPADWLFTNRLQWGLLSVLSSLRAHVPCRDIYLRCLE